MLSVGGNSVGVLLCSVVVIRPTHVSVHRQWRGRRRKQFGMTIESCLQNRLHRLALRRTDGECPCTCRFQSILAIAPGQTEHAQAGAIAHLRMRLVFQQATNDGARSGADAFTPVQETLWRPLQMLLV